MDIWIWMLGILAVIVLVVYKAFQGLFGGRGKSTASGSMICPACGTRGEPALNTKGSTAVELVLWLCLIIPGLIYSIWRVSSREKVCPACRASGMISINTPRGQQLVQQYSRPS